MKRLTIAALALAFVAFAGATQAQEKKGKSADKANPTGTWKWTVDIGGQTREVTLKLKQEGDKLTGTITGRNNEENKIDEGKFKDGEVTFKVTREFNGNKIVMSYSGKVTGDTFKGKSEFERDGEKMTREFDAKRQKDAPKDK